MLQFWYTWKNHLKHEEEVKSKHLKGAKHLPKKTASFSLVTK
jgi:hypothetical protein